MKDFPIIPGRGLVSKDATQLRHAFLEKNDLSIKKIRKTHLELDDIKNNIESYVGSTEIPLGVVGPLLFKENNIEELVYCLGGTLEGALIASMSRGARAISKGGGFTAKTHWQKMSRVPMFLFNTTEEARLFGEFTTTQFKAVKKNAEQYSNHAKLIEIEPHQFDCIVHLKFTYTTGDASGQNMTTTCTWHAMLYLIELFKNETGIVPEDFIIEGNGSSDKKVSDINIVNGRGINVTAECFLPEKVIRETLRTSSEKLYRCFQPSKQLTAAGGMVGFNINVANAIAAIFVATGQDLACIHESGVGILQLEKKTEGLHFKLNLPNLVIGTVGGGTHLPKQAEALKLMSCLGVGKVERFAKLICGFALGLEISTYSAIVSGEFAKAHEKLGRNKPKNWLTRSEITPAFLLSIIKDENDFSNAKIGIDEENLVENGIITSITSRINKKLIGFIPFTTVHQNGKTVSAKMLIKSKALDEDVIKGLHLMAASIDPKLSDLFKETQKHLEYRNSHLKEIQIYDYLNEQHFNYIPKFYGSKIDRKREIFILIQELINYSGLKIFNSENHPERWDGPIIYNVITVINDFHNTADPQKLDTVREFKPWKSKDLYKKLLELLLAENENHPFFQELETLLYDIDFLQEQAKRIDLKKSVIHNDFNSRNIFIDSNNNPIIYDWELAVIDFKHRDIVEFLSFVLNENFTEEELWDYLKYHHNLNRDESWNEYIKAYKYALKSYLICRVSFYEVSGIIMKYDFSRRIMKNAFRMLAILNAYE